jgi:hypothetical protein
MAADWFEGLMGFKELRYEETRANLEVAGSTLLSKVNERRYAIGTLETPVACRAQRSGRERRGWTSWSVHARRE